LKGGDALKKNNLVSLGMNRTVHTISKPNLCFL
jgi:hypothetical protein